MIATVSMAQTYVNDKKPLNENASTTANEQLNLIQSRNLFNRPSNAQASGNSVFIEQVGFGNVGLVAVSSNDSEVNLLQDGYKNKSLILLRADVIRENVQQIGNKNIFVDYSLHGAKSHKVDLLQEGNYNQVISVGRNSISERLKLTQKGTGKSAYIIHN
jgi:hypothetical protein